MTRCSQTEPSTGYSHVQVTENGGLTSWVVLVIIMMNNDMLQEFSFVITMQDSVFTHRTLVVLVYIV